MSELIDIQALKDAVRRYAGEPIKEKDRKCQAICLDMLGTIDAQPTIDAVPVVHGEWKEWDDGDNTWSCSVCGNPFVLIDGTPSDNEMNYCPNCGARMDGERREG